MPTPAAVKAEETLIHVLWINAGLSCDGDSVALTAATQPSIEEIALGALPGLPQIAVHWPLIDFECGPNGGADDFLEWFFKADRGELEPFVLVVEGSIPNEKIKDEGYWCGFGNNPATGQPMTTSEWLDRLAPKATAIRATANTLRIDFSTRKYRVALRLPRPACPAMGRDRLSCHRRTLDTTKMAGKPIDLHQCCAPWRPVEQTGLFPAAVSAHSGPE